MALHLGERSPALLPVDPRRRTEAVEWVFAALNSFEMASVPWSVFVFSGFNDGSPAWKFFDGFLGARLVARFDRLSKHPACREHVARATARPAFVKAHAAQLAHFAGGAT